MQIQPIISNYSNTNFGMTKKVGTHGAACSTLISKQSGVADMIVALRDSAVPDAEIRKIIGQHFGEKDIVSALNSDKFQLAMLLLPYTSSAIEKDPYAGDLAKKYAYVNYFLGLFVPRKENRFKADIQQ